MLKIKMDQILNILKNDKKQKVGQYTKDGQLIKIWPSFMECRRQ